MIENNATVTKFLKILVAVLALISIAACSEENSLKLYEKDQFGIGLERPEDAGLTNFEKKKLRRLRAETPEEMRERMKNLIFYRVKAHYSHEDRNTGETEDIRFDIVAVCSSNVLMDPKGYSVAETGGGQTPSYFFHPTADDGLVFLRVPFACRSGQFVDSVPDDFTPFVAWFDDIHNLKPGLGYASEDVYESPLSQLKFHGASIERTDAEAWHAWRAKRLAEFKPVAFLKSPWGVTSAGNEPENNRDVSHSPYFVGISNCTGMRRFKLPYNLKEKMSGIWPEGKPEFWWARDAGVDTDAFNKAFIFRQNYQPTEGYSTGLFAAGRSVPKDFGIVTQNGGGYLYELPHDKRIAAELYPVTSVLKVISNGDERYNTVILEHIDYHPHNRGFVSCGGMNYRGEVDVSQFGFDQGEGYYLGDRLLWRSNFKKILNYPISDFVERDTHIWVEWF